MQMTQKLNKVFLPLIICKLANPLTVRDTHTPRQAMNYEQRRHNKASHYDLEHSSSLALIRRDSALTVTQCASPIILKFPFLSVPL